MPVNTTFMLNKLADEYNALKTHFKTFKRNQDHT